MSLNKEFTKQQTLENKKALVDQKLDHKKNWRKWPILQEI